MTDTLDDNPESLPPHGVRLFQIYETDLAELEQMLPELCEALDKVTSPRLRVKIRRVKDIISNVRWNYGPHTDVTIIPCGDD